LITPTCANPLQQLLDFEVGANGDILQIDGVQLYPPTFSYSTEPFFVTQADPADALRLRVTGYTLHYSSAETVSEAGIELLPMTFSITSLEGLNLASPPALTVNLLKDANGRLMIASFQTPKAEETSPVDEENYCRNFPLICEWRASLADRINGLKSSVSKGCHKQIGGNPMAEEGIDGKPPHAFRPGHPRHRPHHMNNHHGHRHHNHRVSMFLHRTFLTIIVPILIGIFAGTLTYLIGMALGCFIAVVVAKFRGRSPYERIALLEEESVYKDVASEKEVYTAELPGYDAPPVYVEADEKEVVGDDVQETK
jgi:hypothetical protein